MLRVWQDWVESSWSQGWVGVGVRCGRFRAAHAAQSARSLGGDAGGGACHPTPPPTSLDLGGRGGRGGVGGGSWRAL